MNVFNEHYYNFGRKYSGNVLKTFQKHFYKIPQKTYKEPSICMYFFQRRHMDVAFIQESHQTQ